MDSDLRWDPVYRAVLAAFRANGAVPEGLVKPCVARFLKELGVSEAEVSLLLGAFGLVADDDEIDFDAFISWVFYGCVSDKATITLDDLDPQLAAEITRCDGALAHLMYVQSADTSDSNAAEELHKLIGGTRQSRIGVIGSISYGFPGERYKAEGPEGVERLVEAAAETVVTHAKPLRVVMGGSFSGPQGTFGKVCERHATRPITMVHVIPNSHKALEDLKGILWDGESPRQRQCRWKLAFVGSNFSRRNVILAGLNGNYIMCAGGPGTHTELCELRSKGAGVLPLVRTGGLCEGANFGGKNAHGMVDALRTSPPMGVAEDAWRAMLGDGEMSFEEYRSAVERVFAAVRFHRPSEASNQWRMDATELQAWEDTKKSSKDFQKAAS